MLELWLTGARECVESLTLTLRAKRGQDAYLATVCSRRWERGS